MKFAHLADCHIGSWRDPKLRNASTLAFSKAIDSCISHNVDFILIAGDLFNTSLPAIDNLKHTVQKLKQLKDCDIPVYLIAGSHDFSVSGKTMLDVLEQAGLLVNVARGESIDDRLILNFTVDSKTNTKITGLLGKKGGLDLEYYQSLSLDNLESEQGFKIFLFHNLLSEFKPEGLEKVDSHPISLLPKNFNYYAGGHPHFVFSKQEPGYGLIAYPGPLFPNNFKELEDLERGGFYIVSVDSETTLEWFPIQVHNIFKLSINANNKSPDMVRQEIFDLVQNKEFNNTIITIRITGTLSNGRPSDVNFKEIFDFLYKKSAYFVMKNTNKLSSVDFDEVLISKSSSVDILEQDLIKEHLQQVKVSGLSPVAEEQLVKNLMFSFSVHKAEGETSSTFESRVLSEIDRLLELTS